VAALAGRDPQKAETAMRRLSALIAASPEFRHALENRVDYPAHFPQLRGHGWFGRKAA